MVSEFRGRVHPHAHHGLFARIGGYDSFKWVQSQEFADLDLHGLFRAGTVPDVPKIHPAVCAEQQVGRRSGNASGHFLRSESKRKVSIQTEEIIKVNMRIEFFNKCG